MSFEHRDNLTLPSTSNNSATHLNEENKLLRRNIAILKSELLKYVSLGDVNSLLKKEPNNTKPSFSNSNGQLDAAAAISRSYKNSKALSQSDDDSFINVIDDNKNSIGGSNELESPNMGMPVVKKMAASPSSFGLSQMIGQPFNKQENPLLNTAKDVSIVPPRSSNRKNSNNDLTTFNSSNALDLNQSDTSLIEATVEEDEDVTSKYDNDDDDDFSLTYIINKNTKRSVQMKGLNSERSMTPTSEPRSIKSPRLLDSELNDYFGYNNIAKIDPTLTAGTLDLSNNDMNASYRLNLPKLKNNITEDAKSPSLLLPNRELLELKENKNLTEFSDKNAKPPKSPFPSWKMSNDQESVDNYEHIEEGANSASAKSVSSSIQLSPGLSIFGTPNLSPSLQLQEVLTPNLKNDEDSNKPATSTVYTTSRIQIKPQGSGVDIQTVNNSNTKPMKSQQTPTKIKILDDFDMTYTDAQSQRSSIYNQQQMLLNSPRSQLLQSPRAASKNRHNVIYDNKLHSPMRMEPLDISEIEEDLKTFSDMENANLNLDIESLKSIEKVTVEPIKKTESQKNELLFVQPNELKNIEIRLLSCIHFLEEYKELGFIFEVIDKISGKSLYEFSKKYEQVLKLLLQFQKYTDMSLDIPSHQNDEDNCIPLKIITRYINISNIFKHALKFAVDSENLFLLIKLAEFISTNISINTFGKSNYHFEKLVKEESVKAENYCLIKRYKTLGTSSHWKCRCVGLLEVEKSYCLNFMDMNQNVVEKLKLSSNTILEFYDNNEQDLEKYGCYNGFYLSENGKKSGISNSKNNNKFYISFETKSIRDDWIKKLYQIVKTSTLTSDLAQKQTYSDVQSIKSEESSDLSLSSKMTRSELKRNRMRSLFPFKQKEHSQPTHNLNSSSENLSQRKSIENRTESDSDEYEDSGRVFGNPLHFALIKSQMNYKSHIIPTVVYNCLERLYSDKQLLDEEGLFRISGSSLSIKNLIEKFDRDYDVSLRDADVHVVTGLLKTFLRLLPDDGGIFGLERERNVEEFKKVIDLKLPVVTVLEKFKILFWDRDVIDQEHFSLCYVVFELLSHIVARSSLNKMNLRNIVIVFAPTLDLPVEILVHCIRDFHYLFKQETALDLNLLREDLKLNIPGM